MTSPEIELYSVLDGYVGKLSWNQPSVDELKINMDQLTTVVILDVSGSMGNNAAKFANIILPKLFRRLGYDSQSPVVLITFEAKSEIYKTTVEELHQLGIRAKATTYMNGAIKFFAEVVSSMPNDKSPIRMLTISDGALHDQDRTVKAATDLAPHVHDRPINSQAIRFFTSSLDPDTRGLASVLQFCNIPGKTASLLDISSTTEDEIIIDSIAKQFADDGLDKEPVFLQCTTGNKLRTSPWDVSPVKEVRLVPGANFVWLSSLPESNLRIGDLDVGTKLCGALTFENESVIKHHLENLELRIKLLNIVYSSYAKGEVENAKAYLDKLVTWMESNVNEDKHEDDQVEQALFKNRISILKRKINQKSKGIIDRMRNLLNNSKIHLLNSQQQSAYLRSQVGDTKSGRALARRAFHDQDDDFGGVVHREVTQMATSLAELAGVDDSNHARSFYSLATTLEGIKAVCELSEDENIFDSLEVMDILQIMNIVGIACNANIGDYPDPMVWRINDIVPGCFVSVSDLIAAHEQSGNNATIEAPRTSVEITNVVPYFEDDRIQKFLQSHAPNILDYLASIGMRKVIAAVPKTYNYTTASGIWRLCQELDKQKLEITIELFCRVTRSYDLCFTKLSQDLKSLLFDQPEVDGRLMMFNLANNGLIAMIGPMVRLAKQTGLDTPLLPRILRSIYSCEMYLSVRRFTRNNADSREQILSKLLGIDLEKYATHVGDLFERNADPPIFHDDYHADESFLNEIYRTCKHLDQLVLLPRLIQLGFEENSVEKIKALPTVDEQFVAKSFGISYSLQLFRLFNVVQALLCDHQSKRWNESEHRMLIIDLADFTAANEFLKAYVRSEYEKDYTRRVNKKVSDEIAVMGSTLAQNILKSPSLNEVKALFRDGLEVAPGRVHILETSSSPGFEELKENLINMNTKIELKLQKIEILLTGCDENGEHLWNRGNAIRSFDRTLCGEIFQSENQLDKWAAIKEIIGAAGYQYRNLPNRHGHGNAKPSYWALGYPDIRTYLGSVSTTEQSDYLKLHTNCCGLRQK